MRLLVTRPAEDSAALKAHLTAAGHEALVEPLIEIEDADTGDLPLDGAQALIATSRNGVRALARSPHASAALALPLFAVGAGTAAAARALGFTEVIKGPARAADLVPLIASHAEVNGGPLLHLAGDVLAYDLAGELQRLGFHVLQPVVYTTREAKRLSGSTLARIADGRLDGVILLSPRTASVWVRHLAAAGLQATAALLHHFCLSRQVAQPLTALGPCRIHIPVEPTLKEVLALVSRAAAKSGPG